MRQLFSSFSTKNLQFPHKKAILSEIKFGEIQIGGYFLKYTKSDILWEVYTQKWQFVEYTDTISQLGRLFTGSTPLTRLFLKYYFFKNYISSQWQAYRPWSRKQDLLQQEGESRLHWPHLLHLEAHSQDPYPKPYKPKHPNFKKCKYKVVLLIRIKIYKEKMDDEQWNIGCTSKTV